MISYNVVKVTDMFCRQTACQLPIKIFPALIRLKLKKYLRMYLFFFILCNGSILSGECHRYFLQSTIKANLYTFSSFWLGENYLNISYVEPDRVGLNFAEDNQLNGIVNLLIVTKFHYVYSTHSH